MADHEHDLELIMALAEGTLPPEEAAAAEAALNDEAREELAIQRMAIESLKTMPEPRLSSGERSLLRASVRDAIYLTPAPTPPLARPAGAPWYARLLPVLAGAAALVFVVGIGLNVGGGDDGADTAAVDDGAASVTTTAPAESASGMLRAEDSEPQAEAAAEAAAEAVETTMAAAAEDMAGAEEGVAQDAAEAPAAVLDAPRFMAVGDLNPLSDRLEEALLEYQDQSPSAPLPLNLYDAWAEEVRAQCAAEALDEALAAAENIEALIAAGFGTWDQDPGDAQPGDPAEFYEFSSLEGNVIVVTLQQGCDVIETRIR